MKIPDKSLDTRFERMIFLAFIYSLAIFTAAFLVSYFMCGAFSDGQKYVTLSPFYSDDALSLIYSAAHALIPSVALLCAMFLSSLTPLGSIISAVCLVWRGAALGCCVAAVADRALVTGSRWTVCAVILYFLSSVLIFVLSALSSVYRKMICCAYASDEPGVAASLVYELLKLFLVISGAIFTLSLVSIILL